MIGTTGSDDPTGARREAVIEWELSHVVALASEAVPHVCTVNAWRALICLPDVFFPGGEYVEGWMVYETSTQVKVVEHCWCELAPGQIRHIVDPSIVFLVERGQPVRYFPGVRRSWKETEALEGQWFPHVRFEDFGEDGMGHPAYRAAHDEAVRTGAALANASSPPKELAVHSAQQIPEADAEPGGDALAIFVYVVPSSAQSFLP